MCCHSVTEQALLKDQIVYKVLRRCKGKSLLIHFTVAHVSGTLLSEHVTD